MTRRLVLRKAQLDLFGPRETTVHQHQRRSAHGAVETVTQHQRKVRPRAAKANLWERFGGQSAPVAGEKGYREPITLDPKAYGGREPEEVARTAVEECLRYIDDYEFNQALQTPPDGFDDEEYDDFGPTWSQRDVPDLLGLPWQDYQGNEITEQARIDYALWVVGLAARVRGYNAWGDPHFGEGETLPLDDLDLPWDDRYPRADDSLPQWVAEAILTDSLYPDRKLRLVPVSRKEADDYIAKHHSKLSDSNPRTMYAIGVRAGGRLVAVATAGHPSARWKYAPADADLPADQRRKLDQRNVLELHRVASDGTFLGAASMLVSRLLRLAPTSKRGDEAEPWLFVTYSLASEAGASYKGLRELGLRPTVRQAGKSAAGGARGAEATTKALAHEDKIRWEAGPVAGKADWSILQKAPKAKPARKAGILLRR